MCMCMCMYYAMILCCIVLYDIVICYRPYTWNSDIIKAFDAAGGKVTMFMNGNNWYIYLCSLLSLFSPHDQQWNPILLSRSIFISHTYFYPTMSLSLHICTTGVVYMIMQHRFRKHMQMVIRSGHTHGHTHIYLH